MKSKYSSIYAFVMCENYIHFIWIHSFVVVCILCCLKKKQNTFLFAWKLFAHTQLSQTYSVSFSACVWNRLLIQNIRSTENDHELCSYLANSNISFPFALSIDNRPVSSIILPFDRVSAVVLTWHLLLQIFSSESRKIN